MKYRDNMTIQECRDAIAWGRANNQPDAHLPIAIYRNRKGQISFAALSFVESFKTYKIIEVLWPLKGFASLPPGEGQGNFNLKEAIHE